MEQTTNTMNAASVAENAAKPESAFVWTQRSQNCEVVATTLPITNQQASDVPAIRGIVDGALTTDVILAEEVELISGSGTSPHLQGFLTKSGIQTQARGSDPGPSAVLKALTLVQFTGFADPSGVIFNPTNWQNILLLQDTTGRYIWGDPSAQTGNRIWGLPVIVTPAMTLNTALTGAFSRFSHISRRQNITVEAGYVNDDFAKNKMTLRAEERLSLEIYRAAAFCTVTGLL